MRYPQQLIALVAVAVHIDGKRTVIEPGQPLPELHPHDERELLRNGAIGYENQESDADIALRHAVQNAEQDFAAAREAAQAAAESTQSVDPVDQPATTPAATARRTKPKE